MRILAEIVGGIVLIAAMAYGAAYLIGALAKGLSKRNSKSKPQAEKDS